MQTSDMPISKKEWSTRKQVESTLVLALIHEGIELKHLSDEKLKSRFHLNGDSDMYQTRRMIDRTYAKAARALIKLFGVCPDRPVRSSEVLSETQI